MRQINFSQPNYFHKLTLAGLSIACLSLFSFPNLTIAQNSSSLFLKNNLKNNTTQKNLPANSQSSGWSDVQQIAKAENATIVIYSVMLEVISSPNDKIFKTEDSVLTTKVIKPSGQMFIHQMDLQANGCQERFAFAKLVESGLSCLNADVEGKKNPVKQSKILLSGIDTNTPPNSVKRQLKFRQLHQVLIQPIAKHLPKNPKERVIFIPQFDVARVPFSTLQDEKGKYLIEKHTISTIPTSSVLKSLAQRKNQQKPTRNSSPNSTQKPIQGKDLLIVGNPTSPPKPPQPGEKYSQLPPLPGAEQEANAIAKIFNTDVIIRDAATETAIVQKMPQAKIIHLATQVLPWNGTDFIALAPSERDDGWLSLAEIGKLRLNADLVVLSSDKTALGKITGDGVIGLSRAFFAAGADSVIGSLWSVDDQSTAFLMTKFYEILSKNPDKVSAFRQAMLETMKKYPDPKHWGAFTTIGL